jgi:hypothetical protein
MKLQREVEPAVQRRPVLSHLLDRPDGGAGEDDLQLRIPAKVVEECAQNAGEGGRSLNELGKFIKHLV